MTCICNWCYLERNSHTKLLLPQSSSHPKWILKMRLYDHVIAIMWYHVFLFSMPWFCALCLGLVLVLFPCYIWFHIFGLSHFNFKVLVPNIHLQNIHTFITSSVCSNKPWTIQAQSLNLLSNNFWSHTFEGLLIEVIFIIWLNPDSYLGQIFIIVRLVNSIALMWPKSRHLVSSII
jgi:hypothetical protein